ncbi:MAG: MATE family efflux transporter, partial [Ligilactobacillus agilis]|nr:MATE family efflux transporter [Ligilactobacillus agilis]
MRLEQAVEIYLLSKMFLKFIGITLIGYFFFCVIVRVLTNNAKKTPVEFSILDDSNEELAKTLNGDKGFLRAKITAWLIKFVKNIQLYNSQLVSKKEMVTQNRLRKLYLLDITGHLIVGFSFSSGLIELQNQLLAGIFLPLVYVVVGSSAIMGAVMIISARLVMQLLNTPMEIIDDCVLYMRVVGVGMLAVGAFNGVAAILRALGDSKTPLLFLVVACIINIVLDLLFVVIFKWAVFGVALATVIAQCGATIGCMIYAWMKMPIFRMPLSDYVMDQEILGKSLKVGIPVALQNALIALSCVVLQSVVNSFGATIVAAFTVENR